MNSRASNVDWQAPTRHHVPSNRAGDSRDVLVLVGVPTRFGSTFRDWTAEETNHRREVVDAALAHVVQKVEAAYARSDLFERRRQLMADWSAYVVGATGSVGS